MTSPSSKPEVSRGSESRDTRLAASVRLVAREQQLTEVRAAGAVLAECALGFA
ncbi:MAG: hypothetical protein HOV78_11450 [Hamadaea sp.]|nr:hypothetical protein [Hamadaea sp.]